MEKYERWIPFMLSLAALLMVGTLTGGHACLQHQQSEIDRLNAKILEDRSGELYWRAEKEATEARISTLWSRVRELQVYEHDCKMEAACTTFLLEVNNLKE